MIMKINTGSSIVLLTSPIDFRNQTHSLIFNLVIINPISSKVNVQIHTNVYY